MATVLVVDDDRDAREFLTKYLRGKGHKVTLSPNGYEAMAALGAEKLDLVILDYKMPKMDGLSFLEVVRCYLSWQDLPAILLTGCPEGQHIKRAVKLGVRKTFLKGDYDLSELLAHVETCSMAVPQEQAGDIGRVTPA